MKKGILVLISLSGMATAGIPAWTLTPIGSPNVSVSNTGTATVNYTVTNNSSKPHQLMLSSNTPAGITQSGGPCILTGKSTAYPTPTCTLTLTITGSQLPADNLSGGPVLCQMDNGAPNLNQCYQPNPADFLVITRTTPFSSTTLGTSVSLLALSVNKQGTNAALTGTPRIITISNTGANEATGLNIAYPTWPTGTSIQTTCGSSLAAAASCTITITPGSNATSSCDTAYNAPTPGEIVVTATNVATAVITGVVVLNYGCQYQGGFLYAVDDTTYNTGSIGGKVTSLVDQAQPAIILSPSLNGILWSSDGAGDVSYEIIYGISRASTPVLSDPNVNQKPDQVACDGKSDGACNTNNIYVYYQTYATNSPILTSDYAAGLCKASINGYSNWYLPAICEMDAVGLAPSCLLGTQSMFASLPLLIGNTNAASPNTSCSKGSNCLAGAYWSSTEAAYAPSAIVWYEFFTSSASTQAEIDKAYQLGVRCSRTLTP